MERSPAYYWNLIEYRILRPRWWYTVLVDRLSQFTDENFRRLFQFQTESAGWLEQFHENARFRFFFHPRNQKDFFLHQLMRIQSHEQILQEAEHTVENQFQTLGSDLVSLGDTIHWQRDFKSGKEWELVPAHELDLLDLGSSSDVKIPWELSRFHQVWWLGKAYWLTRNEKYAEKFRDLVNDWISSNPPGRGVNWSIAMEASIRSCNLIAGYYLFCESKSCPPNFWMNILKSLYVHGVFIKNNLEYSRKNGNHFLSNLIGLITLGIFFADTRVGKQWLRFGVRCMEQEMQQEVYADGVNYEKSTSYQRLVLELFTAATVLCQRNNIRLSAEFLERLERMFEYVQHYTRPDGSIPLVGDADDGRLFRFSMYDDINDHRHLLSVGAILFNRNDFKHAADGFSQDALWYFGGEGFEKHQLLKENPKPLASRAFPQGGFYIMRSTTAHVFIDAGDIGMDGRGGHGHNDTLSFEYWADGEAVIVDSGTYAYTFDTAARQAFRSTPAHNTVAIDGKEIAEFAGLWSITEDRTDPRVLEWTTTDDKDILEAEHVACPPVTHRRRFELLKNAHHLLITDRILGTGSHRVESYLHFAPHLTLKKENERILIASGKHASHRIIFSSGEVEVQDSWFSRSYGVREKNLTICVRWNQDLPLDVTITIESFQQTL